MAIERTITAKGRATLPKAVLDHLGVRPGDPVVVSLPGDRRVALVASESRGRLDRLRGRLHRPGQRPVSLAEMQQAIETGRSS